MRCCDGTIILPGPSHIQRKIYGKIQTVAKQFPEQKAGIWIFHNKTELYQLSCMSDA